MRGSGRPTDEATLVAAAQAGDAQALEELVGAHLPLVYTIVGRALGGLPDVDDVVQDTMLCVLRDLPTLRNPDSFRPWLVTIATRQVSTYLRRRHALERTTALDDVVDAGEVDPEGFVLLRLELSRQRRQVVRASQWLDPDDMALLWLWWLETAGWLTRTELAVALGLGTAHAGVRVQRMRIQLELSRSLVAALEVKPRCAKLAAALADWDGGPSPLWRKRIARHTRSCPVCLRASDGLVPPERLLAGLALLPVTAHHGVDFGFCGSAVDAGSRGDVPRTTGPGPPFGVAGVCRRRLPPATAGVDRLASAASIWRAVG
jgi:RNA polymerase sigma factor (sigma-70 family)